MLADLLDLSYDLLGTRIMVVFRSVLSLRIQRPLVPPATFQLSTARRREAPTYLMYVNRIPAHDWSDATLATATSQLKACKA